MSIKLFDLDIALNFVQDNLLILEAIPFIFALAVWCNNRSAGSTVAGRETSTEFWMYVPLWGWSMICPSRLDPIGQRNAVNGYCHIPCLRALSSSTAFLGSGETPQRSLFMMQTAYPVAPGQHRYDMSVMITHIAGTATMRVAATVIKAAGRIAQEVM